MKNFEKYIVDFAKIIKANMNVNNIPKYLYERCQAMNTDEIICFLCKDWEDIAPKKLTQEQREELNYISKRGNKIIYFQNDNWSTNDLKLINDYPQLSKGQTYLIEMLLQFPDDEIVFADKITFSKKYIEIPLEMIKASEKLNFEFKISGIKDIKQLVNRCIFGVWNEYKDRFSNIIKSASEINVDCGTRRTTLTYNIDNFVNNEITFKLEDNTYFLKINNSDFEVLGEITKTKFESTIPLIFGALKRNEIISSYSEFDLHYLKMWNDTQKIDIKPIFNDSGNIVPFEINSEKIIEMRDV